MGATWCRERAAKAQDSKSPIDRVIVKCVNQMTPAAQQQAVQVGNNSRQINTAVVHNNSINPDSTSGWQDVVLKVPDLQADPPRPPDRTPVPPPRKKRANRDKPADNAATTPWKPPTPVIYLEVDTPPVTPHKSHSTPSLSGEVDRDWREKKLVVCSSDRDDLLRIPQRSPSSASITSRRSVSSMSEATSDKLDKYLKSCRSFGSLKPEDLVTEINLALEAQSGSDSSDSDVWAGIDDWDLGLMDHDARTGTPPVTPTSQLAERRGHKRAEFTVGGNPKKAAKPRRRRRTSEKTRSKKKDGQTPSGPVNFESKSQSNVSGITGSSSLIKPSQIPVQDFMRQSSSSLSVKRNAGLTVDCSSFDYRQGLTPPRSPQIELPGTPCTPRGLSRCSSPLPKQFVNVTTPPSSPSGEVNSYAWSNEDDDETQSTLLQLLNEYHTAAELLGDDDAKKILKSLGIPETLEGAESRNSSDAETETRRLALSDVTKQVGNNGSSGGSSITPSLTELEEALSTLLERNAGQEGEEDEEVHKAESGFVPIKNAPTMQPKIGKIDAKPDVNKDKEATMQSAAMKTGMTQLNMKQRMVKEVEKTVTVEIMTEEEETVIETTIKADGKPEITITGCSENQYEHEEPNVIEENKSSSAMFIDAEKAAHNSLANTAETTIDCKEMLPKQLFNI